MKFFGRICFLVCAVFLVTSCSNSDSSDRNRNTAIQSNYRLGYSCAQLLTESATASTTEIRFMLCDDAEMYSIVTPIGVDGSIENQAVSANREVVVPVKSEVNGEATKLIVRTAGADLSDFSNYHSGIHIYDVSLADVTSDEVGQESSLLGSVQPKVVYDMPSPQSAFIYRQHFSEFSSRDAYVSYVEEFVQKWAMVRLTTCHRSVAQGRIANALYQSGAISDAMINAKRLRDIDGYVALDSLRHFVAGGESSVNLCAPGELGFNLFTDGITAGYTPIPASEVAMSNNVLELAKSHMLLQYWKQIEKGECEAQGQVIPDVEAENLDTYSRQGLESWSRALEEKLQIVAESSELTSTQRTTAQRLLLQIDTLSLVRKMRESFAGASLCTVSPAGYAVAVAQPSEAPSATLAPVEPITESDSNRNLSEVVENQAPIPSIPASQLNWAAATNAPLTLRVGQTFSRAQLRALAQLASSSKSTISIARVGSSQKVCVVKPWGVRGLRTGTCRVRVSIKNPGKKAQSKVLSLVVTK